MTQTCHRQAPPFRGGETAAMAHSHRPDPLALAVGAIRLASGLSFLVAPEAANRLWGDPEEPTVTTSLLLRSMGYRDALIGGVLLSSAVRGMPTAPWFLASAGADAADLLGGAANHHRMTRSQQTKGLGGAMVGIAVGVVGAVRASRSNPPAE